MDHGSGLGGAVHHLGPFADAASAFAEARALADRMGSMPSGEACAIVGEFVVPPHDAPPQRPFQTLHFDFGLPLVPGPEVDVARYTALFMAPDQRPSRAVTRLVSLDALLGQRAWASPEVLLERFARYGETHGARDPTVGYVEGSLARLVEAASGASPVLPPVTGDPSFLCGLEFSRLDAEVAFFAERRLDLAAAQIEVALAPGELLLFDNLRVAHGRRGVRRPGELRQLVLGHRGLDATGQRRLRDIALRAFGSGAGPAPPAPGAGRGDPIRRSTTVARAATTLPGGPCDGT